MQDEIISQSELFQYLSKIKTYFKEIVLSIVSKDGPIERLLELTMPVLNKGDCHNQRKQQRGVFLLQNL